MEHGGLGVTQAGEYLLEVVTGQDRLRGDEMLAGEAREFGGGGHHQRTPR